MTSVREYIRRFFQPVQPLPPGSIAMNDMEHVPPYRLHLRIDPDGSGLLIVNAMTVLHLNQSAAEYAYYWLQKNSAEQAASKISKRYRISYRDARKDYLQLIDRIDTLISMPDLDPEIYLNFERSTPNSKATTAPYRLDCALTYQLRQAEEGSAPHDRVTKELTTEEWKKILEKAWSVNIPHIVFTGGEPTLRDDLDLLISHCESIGQVTGLITDGLSFVNEDYLNMILYTGLDHLTILFDDNQTQFWQVIHQISAADIFLAVHITIDSKNAHKIDEILGKLSSYEVKAVSLSTSDLSLKQTITIAYDKAVSMGFSVIWDLPVPYSAFNPVSLETQEENTLAMVGPACLYVEPDGDVLPAQGINRPMGNLLTDSWDEIWGKSSQT